MSQTSPGKQRHAEVAGAGFAGLTAAIALRQRGWSVRVHEKSPELRAEGAGIAMWENGIRVLEAIGAYEAVLARSLANPAYVTRLHGETVSREVYQDIRFRNMTREDLYRAILGVAEREGVDVIAASQVGGADASGILRLASGRELRADLVIGADGVNSKVREALPFVSNRSRYPDGMIRMLVPRCLDQLGSGEWDNVIDSWYLEPRFLRILYAPCNSDDVYLALGASRQDPQGYPLDPMDLDLWTQTCPELAPVLTAAAEVSGYYHPYETTSLDRWTIGQVALVGDSAHSMCPALGQGAGTAMGNAYVLAAALTDPVSVSEVLPLWEQRVRPNTDRCQTLSDEIQRARRLAHGNEVSAAVYEFAMFDPTTVFAA